MQHIVIALPRLLPLLTCTVMLAGSMALAEVPDTAGAAASVQAVAEAPTVDMRGSELELVRARASKASRDGVIVILFGQDAGADRAVHDAAREAAATGIPVRSIYLANVDAAGNQGVSIYGIEGAQYGPVLPVGPSLKSDLLVRIQKWKQESRKIVTDGGVQHCRMVPVTGSRVRREKVCNTVRDDKDREDSSKEWIRNNQNHGGMEALPSG